MKGTLQVSVKDEGLGIKPQDQEKLFDRYYRIENMDTQKMTVLHLEKEHKKKAFLAQLVRAFDC